MIIIIIISDTWTWLRKGNLKKETEAPIIAAQNNTIRTHHIKARIDKMQQNGRCLLCGDHIISECIKLAQKEYKTTHDCVGKMIHWELCNKFEIDYTNKWYIHNPESVLENETQTPLGFWDTGGSPNLGQAIRPTNNQQQKKKGKKRTCRIVDFAVPADHRLKLKENEKKDKYLDLAREF